MCRQDFVFLIICYKVIDVYLSNIHFHNIKDRVATHSNQIKSRINLTRYFYKLKKN